LQKEVVIMRYSLAAVILLSAGLLTTPPALAAVPSGTSGSPDQTGPQMAIPASPPAGQQAHRDVVAPPVVGDTDINKGVPAPQKFPMPVFRPAPGTSAPPQR
jgi:hypothetical protein